MNTSFQFLVSKPKFSFVSSNINYKQAYLKNILRSFFVHQQRYFNKLSRYKQHQKVTKECQNFSIKELEILTSLNRPGNLTDLNQK